MITAFFDIHQGLFLGLKDDGLTVLAFLAVASVVWGLSDGIVLFCLELSKAIPVEVAELHVELQ